MVVRHGICDSIGNIGSSRDVGVDGNDQDKIDEKKNECKQEQNNKYCKILMKKTSIELGSVFKNHL